MITVNESLNSRLVNVSSAVCANSTVEFNYIVISAVKSFVPNSTNDRVVVLFSTSKDPKSGVNFSLSGNNAVYTRNRERLLLDDSDKSGLVEFYGGTAQDLINAWVAQFGDFTKFNTLKVEFGDAVHFTNGDGQIVKTILRVKSITDGSPTPATDTTDNGTTNTGKNKKNA